MNTRERRYQWLGLSPESVLCMLSGWRQGRYVRLPVLERFPDDCEVLDVAYNSRNREFGFLLWSASFPLVPDGEVLPRYGGPGGPEYVFLQFTQPDPDGPLIVERPPA